MGFKGKDVCALENEDCFGEITGFIYENRSAVQYDVIGTFDSAVNHRGSGSN